MSWNAHHHPIKRLNCPHEHMSKAMQAQDRDINPGSSPSCEPAEEPTQSRPDGRQKQSEGQHKETQGGIAAGGHNAQLSHLAITAFDAKTPSISAFDFLG